MGAYRLAFDQLRAAAPGRVPASGFSHEGYIVSELVWRKSSFSNDDAADRDYIEIAFDADGNVHLRESTNPEIVAVTTPAKWDAFVKGVKAGEFDHFAGL